MTAISVVLSSVGEWVWRTSWQASVLVGLVLGVQWLLGHRWSVRWRYALWFLVLARLVVPFTPASAFSIFNFTRLSSRAPVAAAPSMAAGESRDALVKLESRRSKKIENAPLNTATAPAPRTIGDSNSLAKLSKSATLPALVPPKVWSWHPVLMAIWLGGAGIVAVRFAWVTIRFARRMRDYVPSSNRSLAALMQECRHAMGVRSPVAIMETDAICVPAMFGFLRPRLLLPKSFGDRFSPTELRMIFLHELAHFKRGDLLINWLLILLNLLHWFNPVIWLAFARLRSDRELACDELVLNLSREGEAKNYGRVIIKLMEEFAEPARLPGLVGVLEDKNQMERRIRMIARFKKTNRWSVFALVLLLALALLTLTDAQTKSKSPQSPPSQPSQPNLVVPKAEVQFTTVKTLAGANDEISTADGLVLSPNGKFLNWQGRVAPVDGSEPFSLTDRRVWNESWAPNGRLIASCGLDGLYLIPVDADTGRATGPPKKLFSERVNLWGNQRLDWTPDSERIVFSAWNQDFSRPITRAVSVRDGTVSEAPDWAELGVRSPDGRTIAYSPRGDGIWVRPAAGGQARNLSAAGDFKRCEPLAWSADGQWIIGHAGPGEGGDEVRLIHFADGREFKIPVPDSFGVFVGKSPAGDQIFFYRTSCDLAFVPKVMSIQGGSAVVLTARQPGLSIMGAARTSVTTGWAVGMPMGYHWLPDGKSLVVTSVKIQSGSFNHWLFSFTGAEPTELKLELPGLNLLDYGLLAPKGDKLLFTALENGAMPACYIVPVSLREGRSGGPLVKLGCGSADGAAWSPDGTRLAILRDKDLWIISGMDSNRTQLTKSAVVKHGAAWSPDGTMLAYHTEEPDKVELWAVPASGGATRSIFRSTRRSVHSWIWAWSPDSKSITLLDNGVILQHAIEGNAEWELFKLKEISFAGLDWLAWSHDGRKLAFSATQSLTEQDTLFVWTTRGGKPQKLDAQALGTTHFAYAWSPDSQHIAYTCMERPRTRLEGVLSRLDVGEALKLATSGMTTASASTNGLARIPAASTNAVPITDSRFADNFDTGASPSWRFWEDPEKGFTHEHAVKNGELVLQNSRAFLGETDWTNYVVQARICLESATATGEGVAGFCARQTPDNPNIPSSISLYNLFVVCSSGKPTSVYLGILYHDQSGQFQLGRFDLRKPALSLNKWYTLALEVKGRQLRGFLDGQLVAEGVDDRLRQGGIHLNAWNTRVRFDDFSVTLLP